MTKIIDLQGMLKVYREEGFEDVPIQPDEMLNALVTAYNQALRDVSDKLYKDTGYGSVGIDLDSVNECLGELKIVYNL